LVNAIEVKAHKVTKLYFTNDGAFLIKKTVSICSNLLLQEAQNQKFKSILAFFPAKVDRSGKI
jgi:hypothetical protein